MSVVATDHRVSRREHAWTLARSVTDPEMPMLTLEDLGVLRSVEVADDDSVEVAITPTYSGCPAMATMRDDLVHRLTDAGFDDVRVRVELTSEFGPTACKALYRCSECLEPFEHVKEI